MVRGGGVQEIVRDLRRGLVARGHEVKIITPKPRDMGDTDVEAEGIIFLGNGADFRSPLQTVPTFSVSVDGEEIDSMLAQEKFDLLHFHEPWVPVLSRQILSRSTSVNIATFHAKVPETIMSRTVVQLVTPYTKSLLRYLHVLTAVSDAAAEYASTLTDEPVTIIPNGIDLPRFTKNLGQRLKQTDSAEPRTILYLGRLERRKGLKYLLQAYSQLRQSVDDVQLVLAGSGPDAEKLQLLAQDMELPDVSFLGYVPDEVKMELLRTADVFCSPAMFGESFGLVLLEAMASALPVVAGDNSGYSAVMQEFGSISLVNPKDVDDFARRLKLLLNEPVLRADWQKWAKQYIQQFDYPAVIDRYEDLYEYALKHHRHHIKAVQ